MKRLRRFKPVLLITAAAIAGCGAPPVIEPSQAIAPTVKAMSCTERSASARPPKNPIVELAWCIAETDDLYDPAHLFRATLGIKGYDRQPIASPTGIRAGVESQQDDLRHLPIGNTGFFFRRKNPTDLATPGTSHLSFGINPKESCVTMEDVFATFGRDYWSPAKPPVAPARALPGAGTTRPPPRAHNIYALEYRTPRLFMGDPSGVVSFRFDYEECARDVAITRQLSFITYKQKENQK